MRRMRGGGDVVEEERETWESCAGNSKAGRFPGHSFGELDPAAPSSPLPSHSTTLVGVGRSGLDLRHVMQSIKSTAMGTSTGRTILRRHGYCSICLLCLAATTLQSSIQRYRVQHAATGWLVGSLTAKTSVCHRSSVAPDLAPATISGRTATATSLQHTWSFPTLSRGSHFTHACRQQVQRYIGARSRSEVLQAQHRLFHRCPTPRHPLVRNATPVASKQPI